jgi:hypothetical protein
MAGTNAVVIKKALIDALEVAPELEDVQVSYGYPGPHVDRKLIHGGKVEGSQRYKIMRTGGRHPREETLTFKVHIVVSLPGAEVYEVELECSNLGTVLEEWLAANPNLSGYAPDGVHFGGISYVDLDSDSDDEGAIGVLTYDVTFESRLR